MEEEEELKFDFQALLQEAGKRYSKVSYFTINHDQKGKYNPTGARKVTSTTVGNGKPVGGGVTATVVTGTKGLVAGQ